MTTASDLMAHARTLQARIWGQEVIYKRKSTSSELMITGRKSGVMTTGVEGTDIVVQSEFFSWVFAACDLLDAGELFEPDDGDAIAVRTGEQTETFIVGTYNGEPQCWEPADSERVELVVHTKLWGEA